MNRGILLVLVEVVVKVALMARERRERGGGGKRRGLPRVGGTLSGIRRLEAVLFFSLEPDFSCSC